MKLKWQFWGKDDNDSVDHIKGLACRRGVVIAESGSCINISRRGGDRKRSLPRMVPCGTWFSSC